MRKSIFSLVAAVSAVGFLGAACQQVVTTNTNAVVTANTNAEVDNTNEVTNSNSAVNTNAETNANTNTSTNTNQTVNTNSSTNTNTSVNTNTSTNTNSSTNTSSNTNTSANTNVSVNTNTTPEVVNATVTYNGSSFSASGVTISSGGTVTFVNNSTHSLQVSSDNHPSHTKNAEIGTGPVVAAGGTYKLTLNGKGTWGYHNHLNPSAKGTITVQ